MLFQRMRAVAFNAETVEDGNTKCRDKVSVRGTADLCFVKLVIERRGE